MLVISESNEQYGTYGMSERMANTASILQPLLPKDEERGSGSGSYSYSCDAQGGGASLWPANYSDATFIFKDEQSQSDNKEIQCKLQYDAAKGKLQLVPVENADSTSPSNDDQAQTVPVPVPLLEIDPSDVIGIHLAISFDQQDETDAVDHNNPTRDSHPVVEDEIMEDTPMTRTKPRNASALATLNIFSYPRVVQSRSSSCSFLYRWLGYGYGEELQGRNNKPLKRRREHCCLRVAKSEDFGAINDIVRAIQSLAGIHSHIEEGPGHEHEPRRRQHRLLIVLNPHSGTGKAQSVYDTTVKPMLSEAGFDHSLCVTQFAGHATERMLLLTQDDNPENEEEDIACFTGIIALGGDGILYEIMQGLQKREDYAELMERKLMFGIVGCGTSNGLAKSILHSSQVRKLNATRVGLDWRLTQSVCKTSGSLSFIHLSYSHSQSLF
jgi:hypothetical protein